MKRRILMVSAMILLLGSQAQMYAQKNRGQAHKRPGMEMHISVKTGSHNHGKAICQGDIKRLQDFYWKKYRVKLSKKEAERILREDMKNRDKCFYGQKPQPPKVRKQVPRGPQKPPKRK